MRRVSWAWGLPLVLPLAVLLLWWAVTREAFVAPYLLPSPESVWLALESYVAGSPGAGAYQGRFAGDLAASLTRVSGGFALATAVGLPLGVASGRMPRLSRLLSPLVDGLRSVPGICWLPLALVWLGIGFRTTVFLVAVAAFFPVYLNAATGAAAVAPILVRAGSMLGLSPVAVFLRVVLPAAMPHIRAGLRLGLGVGFAYLVLGELTGVPDGIGAMIMDARLMGRVDMILVGILLMSVLGWLGDALLGLVLRAAFKSARRL
uniref:ABC-type nitrate/sulfonate/bicarbonate transport system, permease component n=1 Tax=Desulfovibrio sp. U5L TaxID=596152 RepID=I2Q6V1_9BACT